MEVDHDGLQVCRIAANGLQQMGYNRSKWVQMGYSPIGAQAGVCYIAGLAMLNRYATHGLCYTPLLLSAYTEESICQNECWSLLRRPHVTIDLSQSIAPVTF